VADTEIFCAEGKNQSKMINYAKQTQFPKYPNGGKLGKDND